MNAVLMDLVKQGLERRRVLIGISVVIGGLMLALLVVNRLTGIMTSHVTRDPVQVLEGPFYVGMYSQFGILMWCGSASICLFTAQLLRHNKRGEAASYFASAGVLTGIILLDDLLMLHEEVYPLLGVPEPVVALSYGALAATFVARWRKRVLASSYLLLALAIVFLGASALLDSITQVEYPGYFIIEDGSKLFGIACWSTFFILQCLEELGPTLHSAK